MRNIDTSIQRLKRLASHLKTGQLSQDYDSVNCLVYKIKESIILFGNHAYTFLPFVIEELPLKFPNHFGRNWMARVVYYPAPHLNSHYAAVEFFGLTTEEAQHCFQINAQFPELYKGRKLTVRASKPIHVSRNINALLKVVRQNELIERKASFRQVLIEKSNKVTASAWLNNSKFIFNTSQYQKGVYLIKASTSTKSYSTKLVVQ